MNGNLRWSFLSLLLAIPLISTPLPAAPVQWTEDEITIPTYLVGDPEPNPIFYDGRGSQGAQGRVYPYPLYDSLTHVKSNKVYRVVYLENEYVRIGILPEVGGRLFEAIDKSNGYNFVYRQHVIKPALIGLIGAWISGGIEWNIPHHHRATTALPVQYRLVDNGDGSKTVWVGELEVRQRMRWAIGYTLHPGRSYLECLVRILNRTQVVNTMLCFANVAVHVNDDYQVIYPPHTQFVTFHSKHEFTTWPIATTRYAGADFTRGVDVSWYSNHVSANSMFAWNYQDDFFAGYDHGRHAGIMSFADHEIVPGKKFWTWGNGPRGRMWDKILTDSDGPYIELMVGGYSDNQPDYSWLQPYETKSFEMYWYPFRDIEGVKAANLDGAVNLEVNADRAAKLGFCTTRDYPSATALLLAGTNVLLKDTFAISPAKPYTKQLALPTEARESDLRASLVVDGKELVAYSPVHLEASKMPEPVQDPLPPKDIKTIEELYLAGQRIEQFYSANLKPEPYWDEALSRDPGDARVNTVLAIRLLKQARFAEAEEHLRTAIQRLTRNYTAPRDGEAFYYLGLTLQSRAQVESSPPSISQQAMDAFSKATWSQAWRGPAYFALAQLASLRGDAPAALKYAEHSLEANTLNLRALNLKAALLRHANRMEQAHALLDVVARTTDPLDVRLMTERWLAGDNDVRLELARTIRAFPSTGLETAVEYGDDGLSEDAISILQLMAEGQPGTTSPLVYYYLGEFQERLGLTTKASESRRLAAAASPNYVFPFQWEAISALRHACERDPKDARVRYYLGNLLFDWQPAEATRLWEESARLDPAFAIVHRNLALAYAREATNDATSRAIEQLEKAVAAPVKYALHFAELDELYAKQKVAPSRRLALLENNHNVVAQRDDALSREIGLMVFAGKYDRAIDLMANRSFSVWEGGSLDVAQHWVSAHILRGRTRLEGKAPTEAVADFESAKTIPDNLPNDSGSGGRLSEIEYWIGVAYSQSGEKAKAEVAWHRAAEASGPKQSKEQSVTMAQVQLYFAALAQRNLGQNTEAESTFHRLLDSANKAMENQSETPTRRRRHESGVALAHFVAGLAHSGLGETEQAKTEFNQAIEAEPDMVGAKFELAALKQ
jgi:tetratricopeptide (TPR) repeat protein